MNVKNLAPLNDTWLIIGLVIIAIMLFGVSLMIGQASIPMSALIDAVGGVESPYTIILQELRFPRAILALVIGASLGIAGAALQGLLRNPLAEPGLIGVSGCAALGAVLVFYSGLASVIAFALPLGGMLGAGLAVILLYIIAGRGAGVLTLILAGVAINALAGALTTLALNLSPNPYALFEIFFLAVGVIDGPQSGTCLFRRAADAHRDSNPGDRRAGPGCADIG